MQLRTPDRHGAPRDTSVYQCRHCTALFKDPDRFSAKRIGMPIDGMPFVGDQHAGTFVVLSTMISRADGTISLRLRYRTTINVDETPAPSPTSAFYSMSITEALLLHDELARLLDPR